jgi:hypothetical protein
MITLRLCLAVVLVAAAAPTALAQPQAAPASDFSLTIYSTADPATFDPHAFAEQREQYRYNPQLAKLPGYGVVRETRKIDLQAGENALRFTDVASGIDPTTVAFKSLTAPDSTAVLEQSYEYDLVSPDKLLQKYVGQNIIINRKQEPLQTDRSRTPETIQGKLLSYDGSTFVLQTDNRQLPVQLIPRTQDLSEIKLFDLQTGLITKPTLVWKVRADKAGQHDAQVTYQTDNLTWRADYTVLVNKDDTAADIGAWVSILNESGASYANAKLKLVAGDVQRLAPQPQPMQYAANAMKDRAAAAPQFAEKSFFEYHLYALQRTTTLPNNSTKQIELFPTRQNVGVTKTYVYYGLPADARYWFFPYPNQDRNLGSQANKKVDIYLQIQNSEKSGLGLPLPAGRVRVYKKDEADSMSEFIGEDLIQHTPKDEQLLVRVGSAFDIVGDRKQTDFNMDANGHVMTESFEITLRNHKKEPAKVLVKENLFRWINWEITKSSDKFEKQDYRTIHLPIEVPPDGEKKLTYTVKYTW